ncbi:MULTISPECIES: YycC family protein [unclassified Bacillus (in: firmicutes)]|uniref:YycC family protein n=1 Tax=unclassified Bacillus (in: firmicutes) TaxID=185979 RepID=UPI000BEFFB7F|nr:MULTISPECIES: YycC family protein [unclassified Bacillus (in: firmicutes)]PEJ52153.1 YycC family protein [Bacillus sp. AFS002410]PEL11251.1 YycC family protein [Bacillus sp. AFS017336]
MRPLQISPETAILLSKKLNVPLEQVMHMPQHILMKKLMELDLTNNNETSEDQEKK